MNQSQKSKLAVIPGMSRSRSASGLIGNPDEKQVLSGFPLEFTPHFEETVEKQS